MPEPDPFLEQYLDAYGTAFDGLTGLATLCFGAAVFLMLRGFGIVADKDVPRVDFTWLLVAVVFCAAAVFLAVFLAESQIAAFYDDMFQRAPAEACTWPIRSRPEGSSMTDVAMYFQDCIRGKLRVFLWFAFGFTAISVILLLIWLVLQIKANGRSRDETNDANAPDGDRADHDSDDGGDNRDRADSKR